MDESGDTGYKFARGSSPFFVVALCGVAEQDRARVEERLERVRLRCGLQEGEFLHFVKLSEERRIYSVNELCRSPISFVVTFVNKRIAQGKRPTGSLGLYQECLKPVLLKGFLKQEDSLVAHERCGRAYERQLKSAIHQITREAETLAPHRIRAGPTRAWPNLQMADIVAGAVFQSLSGHDRYCAQKIKERAALWLPIVPCG